MDIPFIIAVLLVISFLWAILSLHELQKDERLHKKVKKELLANRIIFQSEADHSASRTSSPAESDSPL
ncbi:MAG: hypothetical protein HY429_00210 [Candidatus Levybacteria bacterium]|nr:hypothetical protein [Candidatus Levybacteria bacterium]